MWGWDVGGFGVGGGGMGEGAIYGGLDMDGEVVVACAGLVR
jgi:hypothetical protein